MITIRMVCDDCGAEAPNVVYSTDALWTLRVHWITCPKQNGVPLAVWPEGWRPTDGLGGVRCPSCARKAAGR